MYKREKLNSPDYSTAEGSGHNPNHPYQR